MSTITFVRRSSPIKKRPHLDESNTSSSKKKIKHSLDITSHWKKIQAICETDPRKAFPCKSKNDYLIIQDPLAHDRTRFVICKSSFYWLNESARVMPIHIEYGSTHEAATIAEITEIERNLKALKVNVEKNGLEKTFFSRAEALVHFIRFCCTLCEHPLERFRRRLHVLFNLCANAWLHMFDIMLPMAIVRVQKSFLLDDDHEDFETGSILRHYLKDDQIKIKRANIELPHLRHLLYSIVCLIEQFDQSALVDRIYLERFEIIYEIWIQIDNELNARVMNHWPTAKEKRQTTKSDRKTADEKISWNFLAECGKYEKLFGFGANHVK